MYAPTVEPEPLQISYRLQHCNGYCDFGISGVSSTLEIFISGFWKLKVLQIKHYSFSISSFRVSGTQQINGVTRFSQGCIIRDMSFFFRLAKRVTPSDLPSC
jgi:hypothetical protein